MTHLFPYGVLLPLFDRILQQRNIRQILLLIQQHAQLKERIRIIEEIRPPGGAEHRPRLLYLNKEHAQRLVQLLAHDRRLYSKLRIDVLNMLKVFVVAEFPQNLAHFRVIERRIVFNTLLLEPHFDGIDDLFRYLRGLLGLELGEDFLEMVEANIGGIRDLIRRLFVGGFGPVDDVHQEFPAKVVVTDENALFLLRDQLALGAELADVGGDDKVVDVTDFVIDVLPIFQVGLFRLRVFVAVDIVGVGGFRLDFEEGVENIGAGRRGGIRNLLFLLEILENEFGVL